MPAMRRRTFRNHLSFPESMANMRMGLRPMLLPHGREILPEHPDTCSGGNVASESATLVWRRKKAGASSRCYGNTLRRFLGPSPAVGNGPRRTRRLRSRPQHGTRPGHVPTCRRTDVLQKFCRLTPPAFAGSSHRQTAGGGGQNLVRYRSLRTLCCFQRTVPARVPVVMAQQSALNSKAPKDIRRLLPFLPFVEIRNNENEFQCQLFFCLFHEYF